MLNFTLKRIQENRIFGTKTVWRGRTRIAVSDVHRTIIDMLDDVDVGAGIQHVADCLASYFSHRDRNVDKLIAHAEPALCNGAVFKRLGMIWQNGAASAKWTTLDRRECQQGEVRRKATAKLDPGTSTCRSGSSSSPVAPRLCLTSWMRMASTAL